MLPHKWCNCEPALRSFHNKPNGVTIALWPKPNCITRSRTGEPMKAKPGERTIQFNALRAGREKIHLLAFLADDTRMNRHASLKIFRETRLFPWQGVWGGFLVGVLR